jgi:oxygen-independent coproporphyrinogen-3 oxidase
MALSPEIVLQHASRAVPRYTSYPTAPHFSAEITGKTYRNWLLDVPENATLSLYLHIPFCDTLCWFCGCHTKITRQYAPIEAYLTALKREIDLVTQILPSSSRVTHIHWGGGSPTILHPDDIRRLADHLGERFSLSSDCDFAVEVDPRGMDSNRIEALLERGLSRVSIGVQDFDPAVQAAINRFQSVAETRAVIDQFRAGGIRSLNIDAVYGLPKQGLAQLESTLDSVMAFRPDRLALFGYAHVPWVKRHQAMILDADLPGAVDRHTHALAAGQRIQAAGYQTIGIDHFALPQDSLAIAQREGRLRRNFQGYTDDPADVLIGLGASSISALPQGYVQNEPAMARYQREVESGHLPAIRGRTLTEDDRRRARIIERLMCDLRFSAAGCRASEGTAAEALISVAERILRDDRDGFVEATDDGFVITEDGRPFTRLLAAEFDAYLAQRPGGHSLAV